jgi:hypothetical protein
MLNLERKQEDGKEISNKESKEDEDKNEKLRASIHK